MEKKRGKIKFVQNFMKLQYPPATFSLGSRATIPPISFLDDEESGTGYLGSRADFSKNCRLIKISVSPLALFSN